jgi:hypothetical protein
LFPATGNSRSIKSTSPSKLIGLASASQIIVPKDEMEAPRAERAHTAKDYGSTGKTQLSGDLTGARNAQQKIRRS